MTTQTQLSLFTERIPEEPENIAAPAAAASQPRTSPEELRFIYRMIIEGYSDADILREYANLNDAGKLAFPQRTGLDFVGDRRREMEVAVQILKDGIKTMIDPLITKQKEEHQAQLSEISAMLLQNDLQSVGLIKQNRMQWAFDPVAIWIIYRNYWPKLKARIPVDTC